MSNAIKCLKKMISYGHKYLSDILIKRISILTAVIQFFLYLLFRLFSKCNSLLINPRGMAPPFEKCKLVVIVILQSLKNANFLSHTLRNKFTLLDQK